MVEVVVIVNCMPVNIALHVICLHIDGVSIFNHTDENRVENRMKKVHFEFICLPFVCVSC